ncbi:MAG: signal recognition particle protein [Nitriliruptorales bacterium]
MFDALSDRLESALARVRGRGRLDDKTVDATLREIRLALLEADVNFKVVRDVVARLHERLVGEEVSKALNPSQQVIRAVNDELTRILGQEAVALELGQQRPAVLMLAGLQGSGKTSVAGKLAGHLKRKGRRPMLVACDLQRPAAVEQLRILASQAGVHIYAPVESGDPVPVARDGVRAARDTGCDVVIVDTAGRLHVDEEMMAQARAIRDAIDPIETLFVIDAMIGQEAVNIAKAFLDEVGFEGVVLTKLDGDARGGAALSVTEVTGKPIKFASVGEKLDEFEAFHPDRMASRILGMGDVMTLIEKAEVAYSEEEARRAEEALVSGDFTLDDFLEQMQQLKKMGSLQSLLGMLPGVGRQLKELDIEDRQLARVEAIIRSMTRRERRDVKVLNGSRRKRIAAGSGTTVTEVNRLIKQFQEAQKVMRSVMRMSGVGSQGGKSKKGLRGQVAQARALRDLQQSGQIQLPAGGLGGFPGLQPAPKGPKRKKR